MRALLVVIAVTAALGAGGCGDDEEAPPPAQTSTLPRPISAGYCLDGAGVQKVASTADLSFVALGSLADEASAETGVGKQTASFTAGKDRIYVVGRPGQQISRSDVLTSPMTYEYVGFLKAPAKAAAAKAGDCLDGLDGDDR